jgi:hypothetical protein
MLGLGLIIELNLYYGRSSKPNPNLAKSGQATAEASQRKSKKKSWIFLDSLRGIGPFQWVAPTPWAKKSLSALSLFFNLQDPAAFQSETLGQDTIVSGFRKANSRKCEDQSVFPDPARLISGGWAKRRRPARTSSGFAARRSLNLVSGSFG